MSEISKRSRSESAPSSSTTTLDTNAMGVIDVSIYSQIDVNQEASKLHIEILEQNRKTSKHTFDIQIGWAFLGIFFLSNVAVWVVIIGQWAIEANTAGSGTRVVTENVLLALIGGTTIQAGAIALALAKALFRG